MRASVPVSGLALPMSRRRYTSAESTLTISVPRRAAQSSASAVLPEAVGPISAIANGRRSSLIVVSPLRHRRLRLARRHRLRGDRTPHRQRVGGGGDVVHAHDGGAVL